MIRRLSFLFLCALALRSISAGEQSTSVYDSSGYESGSREFEVLGGAFTSINDATRKRPQFNFALSTVRIGWMLDNPRRGIFFGNEEFLIEGFAGPMLEGPGSVLAGATLLLRHNFLYSPNAFAVPYFQFGAGGLYSDAADDDKVQFGIGSTFEFNLQATLGVSWRVNHAWSISTEFGYRHISNAGFDSRNGGVDAVGGFVGFGRKF
jgi:opacity protein-like surface antigen